MGADRGDTDPGPTRTGTEPGLGREEARSEAQARAVPLRAGAARAAEADTEPAAVDFDALHAALGDPLDYEEMPSGPALEKGVADADDLLDELEAGLATSPNARAVVPSESSGRSSATYASSRPRTIPPTRPPTEDPNAPAVIVATDDTVPSAPPQMTVPLPPGPRGGALLGGPPSSRPGLARAHDARPSGAPGSGPHHSAPPAPSYGQTPMPFAARGAPQVTMRMPDRPANPRRAKTPTVVVRPRGPSMKQKLVAFLAMLVLVTACGIAVIVWRQPSWLGLEVPGSPSATTSVTSSLPSLPATTPSEPTAALTAPPLPPPVVAASAPPVVTAVPPPPVAPRKAPRPAARGASPR